MDVNKINLSELEKWTNGGRRQVQVTISTQDGAPAITKIWAYDYGLTNGVFMKTGDSDEAAQLDAQITKDAQTELEQRIKQLQKLVNKG